MNAHPSPMLKVHSPAIVEPDPQHGWQMVFWLGEAFSRRTRFRSALQEIVVILQSFNTVKLELPPYAADEDFVEGSLVVGAASLKTYYEYSLGYLALMSGDKEALEEVAAKVLPFVSVAQA